MKSEYPYREIAPKVYMINEFNVADCYLLVGTERALLIDMGVGLGNLRAFVQRLTGGLPLDVVATHGHVDHIGGRGQFPRVSVQKEDVGIIGRVTVPYRKAFFALQRQAAPYGVKAKDIRPGEYHSEPLPMHEGQVFRLGGKTVSVTHVPGHTRGSVCLLAEEDRLLFTGDNGNPVLFQIAPRWKPGCAVQSACWCLHGKPVRRCTAGTAFLNWQKKRCRRKSGIWRQS